MRSSHDDARANGSALELVLGGRHWPRFALLLTAATVTPGPVLVSAAHLLRLVFLCYVVGLVFRRVLGERAITLDTVAGAACTSALIGLAWGDLFLVLDNRAPA